MTKQLNTHATAAGLKLRSHVSDDECLVADPRGSVRPSQLVEQKLLSLLKTNAVPVSYTLLRNRVNGQSR